MWHLTGFLLLVVTLTNIDAHPKRYSLNPPPKNDDNRLSPNVQPTKYYIDLTVSEDNLKSGTFSGKISIDLVIDKTVESFPIHAKYLTINEMVLTTENGTPEEVEIGTPNPSNDFLTIKPEKSLPEGIYNLEISYEGILSDTDLEGLYRSRYLAPDGSVRYLATTHFEELGARRAFPCFDEPALKATFSITVSYPMGYNALSNSEPSGEPQQEGDLMRVTFKDTPWMSTYLVAIIVSDFICRRQSANDVNFIDICARPGTETTMDLALEVTPQALDIMRNYTTIGYGHLGNPKLNQVAIPDFMLGGMENWGLVTYREPALLADDKESSNFYKQKTVRLITHELSHQWFGDYVTLDWWSDIFLNEGLATYFEYHAADQIKPSWELTKQFVIDQIQTVLVSDSDEDSKPLHYDPSDQEDIEGRFDGISYNKGGTVVRMLQHFLELQNFKNGLVVYLNKGPISTPETLWSSFDQALEEIPAEDIDLPATVEEIMDNWTNKPGYPLLKLTLMGNSLTITQERFLLSGSNDGTKWYVPITYSTSTKPDFTKTSTQLWLVPEEDATLNLEDSEWIVLNNQQVGYYRIDYNDTLLERISEVLNNNLEEIDEITRSQLVDDQINLARSGRKTFSEVLKFLSFLTKDRSYYSWSSAFAGFNYLFQRTQDPEIRANLKSYIATLMETLSKSVPFDHEDPDNQIYTLTQVLALTWACNLGDQTCISDANTSFSGYVQDETLKPSANLRSIVYCNGLRYSNNPSDDFNFLWAKYIESDLGHEQLTLLQNIGCVGDSTTRKRYLDQVLKDSVRTQDVAYVFQSVYSNNPEGVDEVFEFITENYNSFSGRFGKQSPLIGLIYTVADLFTTQEQIDKMREFAQIEGLDETIKSAGENAVEIASANLQTIAQLEDDLRNYFG